MTASRIYRFKVYDKNNKMIQSTFSHFIRRISNRIRLLNWQNRISRVYLKVDYGYGFHNDGDYENQKDLLRALTAFHEEEV